MSIISAFCHVVSTCVTFFSFNTPRTARAPQNCSKYEISIVGVFKSRAKSYRLPTQYQNTQSMSDSQPQDVPTVCYPFKFWLYGDLDVSQSIQKPNIEGLVRKRSVSVLQSCPELPVVNVSDEHNWIHLPVIEILRALVDSCEYVLPENTLPHSPKRKKWIRHANAPEEYSKVAMYFVSVSLPDTVGLCNARLILLPSSQSGCLFEHEGTTLRWKGVRSHESQREAFLGDI